MTWPDVASKALDAFRPAILVGTFILGLLGYRLATSESLFDTLIKTAKEVNKLVKGERGPHSINALTLILTFFLAVLVLVTPLKDIFLWGVATGAKQSTELLPLAIECATILFFFAMGLVCVRLCRFYDGD